MSARVLDAHSALASGCPRSFWISSCVLVSACLPPLDSSRVDSWQGDEVHFIARGELEGEVIDISVEGLSVDDATGRAWCVREYFIPRLSSSQLDYDNGVLPEIEIHVNTVVEGEPGRMVVQLTQRDFESTPEETELTIIPRDELEALAEEDLWMDIDWYGQDDELLSESSAQDGAFALEVFSGEPGSDGLVIPAGEGMVGGHVSAIWGPRDQVTMSFTVICTENLIETDSF